MAAEQNNMENKIKAFLKILAKDCGILNALWAYYAILPKLQCARYDRFSCIAACQKRQLSVLYEARQERHMPVCGEKGFIYGRNEKAGHTGKRPV